MTPLLIMSAIILVCLGGLAFDAWRHHRQQKSAEPQESVFPRVAFPDAPSNIRPTILSGPSHLADEIKHVEIPKKAWSDNAGEVSLDVGDGGLSVGLGGGVVMGFDGDIGVKIVPGLSLGFGGDD